ncbi:MAG: glycosyltransferase [Nitrospirota bacterium]
MKVLILSRLYPNDVEPTMQIPIEEQAKFFSKKCEIKVISPKSYFPPIKCFKSWYKKRLVPKFQVRNGIEVYYPRYFWLPYRRFPLGGIFYFLGSIFTVLKIKKAGFDFDIIHTYFSYPDGFAAVLIGKWLKKPVVIIEGMSYFTSMMESPFCRPQILYAIANSKKVICETNAQRKKICAGGVKDEKTVVLQKGVDLSKFKLNIRPIEQFPKKLLFVGLLIPRKGIVPLINVVKRLTEAGYNIILDVIGDGELREDVKEQVRELRLEKYVNFLGARPNEEVAEYMQDCDLFVLPSFAESFGVVVIEALACGKPVVSTYCGGPEDILTKDTGILIQPGDENALFEAIKYILDNPQKYDSQRIRKYAECKYDLDIVTSKMVELYQQILNEEKTSCK